MAKGRQHLTDDDIVRIRILHQDGGCSIPHICKTTGFSRAQVRRAITATQGPRQRKGPPPALGPEEEADLIRFITASARNRFLSWQKVAKEFADGAYSEKSVRNALLRLGYKKSPANETVK
ncbi:hypothetical protein F4859DRAFT_481626 [Xylaria cf. heliscus]|nr:hypothetical protein F4859DRAFT_481626 [Xylaria cf. heliscus]